MSHFQASPSAIRSLATAVLLCVFAAGVLEAQPVTVSQVDPPVGEQETTGLIVRITGKNFAPGARADFFKAKTSDPAGVAVRQTTFVSATELEATLDIASDAALSYFDVRVTNLSGRSGKGSDLFQVVEKGNGPRACLPAPLPSWLQAPLSLNAAVSGGPRFNGRMGDDVAAAPMAGGAILVAANAGASVVVTIVSDDGAAGLALSGQLVLLTPQMSPRAVALGDLTGDGVPEVVAGDRVSGRAVLFVSSLINNTVSYSPAQPIAPAGDGVQFGADIAIADDLVAIAQWGVNSGKTRRPGMVHVYRWVAGALSAGTAIVPALAPALRNDDGYGVTVRLADVAGGPDLDIIAGAGGREIDGLVDAGSVFVFPGPSFDANPSTAGREPIVLHASTPSAGEHYGVSVGAGPTTSNAPDVIAGSLWTSSDVRAEVTLNGLLAPTPEPGYTARPPLGLEGRFGEPGFEAGLLNYDTVPDLVAPAPDASCGGAVLVFLGSLATGPRWDAPTALQTIPDSNYTGFGSSVSLSENGALRVLVVGEKGRTVGGVDDAGQVYVYRVRE